VTQAVEGSPYAYQIAATGTAAVTFALTSAPTGATLSGGALSWTPTAQQSRVSNNFTVTATASGASATQSWAVTPSGTIRISHIDTYWNEDGSTAEPFDWSPIVSSVAALVPQPDGSLRSLSGTAGANGAFEIPNVPAGYYWLRLGSRDTYWTNSSTFDVGSDVFVAEGVGLTTSSTTNFTLSFTSLDPTPGAALLQIDALETGFAPNSSSTNAGSTTYTGGFFSGGNLDYSSIKTLFVRQYEPTPFGSITGYVMGPELTLLNQSLTTGAPNTLSGSLNPKVPASVNLSVQGSAWTPLFEHIAPAASTSLGGAFYLSVHPYVDAGGPNVSLTNPSMPINLLWANENSASLFTSSTCSGNSSTNPSSSLTADVEAGTVPYSDPFPAAWRRTFRVCHTATVNVPLPGGASQGINLTNTQTTSVPTATVKPLLSAVQNPKINGADLFTASTVNSAAVTLSWDPPAIGSPFGYNVSILSPTSRPGGGLIYVSTATLGTAKTSMTIPPDLLQPGQAYLFVITSLVDARANMETSPHRSTLPTSSADVVSAAITTQ
jgi:hypothetical protein